MRLMQPARPGGQGGDERGPTGRCAFPATDGSADLRLLPPSQSAIMGSTSIPVFGRNAQNTGHSATAFLHRRSAVLSRGWVPDGFRRAVRPSLAD